MLLGNRKKQEEEQNWCIVLTPLRNEIDKKRVARKISEVFSLSIEESLDLVSNTPIILLDNLSRSIAVKVKDYFRSEGADLVLTNDIFYKRKCYRTVWPEAPNLSFLNQWNADKSPTAHAVPDGQALRADEALEELRTMNQVPPRAPPREREQESAAAFSLKERKQLLEELETWRRECLARRSEVERLQASLSKAKNESPAPGSKYSAVQDAELKEKDRQIRDHQALIKSLQEKYDALREEYRQARGFFEDKVASSSRDTVDSKGKLKSFEDKARALHEKNQILEAQFEKASAELKQLQGRQSEEHRVKEAALKELSDQLERERRRSGLLEAEIAKLNDQRKSTALSQEDRQSLEVNMRGALAEQQRLKALSQELENRLQTHVEQRAQLETRLADEDRRYKALEESSQKVLAETRERRDLYELKLADSEKELQAAIRRIQELTDAVKKLSESQASLTSALDDKKVLEEQHKSQSDVLIRKYNALIVQYDEDKIALLRSEQTIAELEKEVSALRIVSEECVRKTAEAENKSLELETSLRALQSEAEGVRNALEEKNADISEKNRLLEVGGLERESLKRAFQEQTLRAESAEARVLELGKKAAELEEAGLILERSFEDKTKQLEARDREIDGLRRQIRDLNFQMEQRETMLKRNQIMSQMAEKEDRLKRLVEDQTRVETEIRQREELMRQILTHQETLEKEIVESKQAQRHLLEQVKKEKTAPQIRAGKNEASSSPSALASQKESSPHD